MSQKHLISIFTQTMGISVTHTEYEVFKFVNLQMTVQLSTRVCGPKIQHVFSESANRSSDLCLWYVTILSSLSTRVHCVCPGTVRCSVDPSVYSSWFPIFQTHLQCKMFVCSGRTYCRRRFTPTRTEMRAGGRRKQNDARGKRSGKRKVVQQGLGNEAMVSFRGFRLRTFPFSAPPPQNGEKISLTGHHYISCTAYKM